MVDNRLHASAGPSARWLRREGLSWFTDGDNADYFADELLTISQPEVDAWQDTAERCFSALLETVKRAVREERWQELGIPSSAHPLVRYSVANELDDFLLGRFDFAGGFGDYPIKMLEFNADTCSLIPETALIQRHIWAEDRRAPGDGPQDGLYDALVQRFQKLLAQHPRLEASLLVSSLGFEEDWHNCNLAAKAAREAGFQQVHQVDLEAVIFDPEQGLFIELGPDRYLAFDFWYKMIPWDFIVYDEPGLLEVIAPLILRGQLKVLNPIWTMAAQSKGILPLIAQYFPAEAAILRASFTPSSFANWRYARKPRFGRTGENVAIFDGASQPLAENSGDFADQKMIYQELAKFAVDLEGYRYQASSYFTDHACALAFRRQDDLIIDDDAEFIAHSVI